MTTEERKQYQKEWHLDNKDYRLIASLKRQAEIKLWFHEIKRNHKCNRCIENDPACLDFHHIDQSSKQFNLSDCYNGGYSKETILAEIAKCEVLCSNCHRKLHNQLYGQLTDKQQIAITYDFRKFKSEPGKCKKCNSLDLVKNRRLCKICWREIQQIVMSKRNGQVA